MVQLPQIEIYKELLQELKKKICNISTTVSCNSECENIEERFAIFYCQYKKPSFIHIANILKQLRILRTIVETDMISTILQEICVINNISYNDLRNNRGDLIGIVSERNKIDLEYFENPSIKKPYPLFEESELLFKYSEWYNFAPMQKEFPLKLQMSITSFCSQTNALLDMTHETFKSLYYLYTGFYRKYYLNSFIRDINNKELPTLLYLEENKDILEYLNDTTPSTTSQNEEIIERQFKDCFLAKPTGFTKSRMVHLADSLVANNYISEAHKETFTGLFFNNETSFGDNRIITWQVECRTLKYLFMQLYPDRDKVPRGTWTMVKKIFRQPNGYEYGDDTLGNLSRDKVKAEIGHEEAAVIDRIIENAKMYKET